VSDAPRGDLGGPGLFEPSLQPPPRFTTRSISYLSIVNFAAQVGDRLFSFGQVAVIAALFGAGTNADIFFLASIVPLTIGAVIGEPLGRAFLTMLVKARDARDGAELAAAGFLLGVAATGAVTLLYLPVAWAVVRIAAPAGSSAIGPWFVFAALGPAMGSIYYLGAVLLWLERYELAALRIPLSSLSVLVAMIVASQRKGTDLSLAVAVAIGTVLALVLLYIAVARWLGILWGFKITRRAVREATASRGRLFGPVIGGIVGGQAVVLIERVLAAPLGIGAVATISYARGIAGAPAAVGVAMGAGTYPAVVRAQAIGARDYLQDSIVRGLRFTATVSVSIALLVGLFATNLVQVLFQRGQFVPSSTHRVATILAAFAVSTFASNLIGFLAQMLYGLDRFSALLWVQVAVFAAYLALAPGLRIVGGLVGLGIAFSLAQLAGAGTAYFLTSRRVSLDAKALRRRVVVPVVWRTLPIALGLGLLRIGEGKLGIGPIVGIALAGAIVVVGSVTTLALERAPRLRNL
jgi:putative peptidoglycan lipid II flippase